jgi:hypothetical protein
MDDKGGDWSAPRAGARADGEALATRLERAARERGLDLDEMARERLREAADLAEAELARHNVADGNLPFLCATDEGPVHLKFHCERTPSSFRLDVTFDGATPQGKPGKRSPARVSMADLDSLELKPGERELVERMITQRDDPAKSTVPVLVIMILVCSIIFLGSVLLVAFLSL